MMKILGLFKVIVYFPMENPSCGESIFFVNTIWLWHVMTFTVRHGKSTHAIKNAMAHLFRSMGHGSVPWLFSMGNTESEHPKGFFTAGRSKKKLGVRPEKTTNPNISQHISSQYGGQLWYGWDIRYAIIWVYDSRCIIINDPVIFR